MAAITAAEAAKHPFLALINEVDNVPLGYDFGQLFRLLLPNDDRPHGYVAPSVVDKLAWSRAFVVDQAARTVQLTDSSSGGQATGPACNEAFQTTIDEAIATDAFPIIHGEHSELIPILGANQPVVLERFAAPLFGIAQRGAHMTAFARPVARPGEPPQPLRIWVPRRSRKLFTYPGMLDSTVAGGVKAGDAPFDCIVAEAHEEASLAESFVREHATATGIVSYVSRHSAEGYIVPTVLYVYDIALPEGVAPVVNDEEVEDFSLWTVQEVLDAMTRREFKPNSAVVMIDFFVRHGILTQENVPAYIDITTRLRRHLPVPVSPAQLD